MPPSWLGKTREGQRGANHPNYGSIAHNVAGVDVYTLDGTLVNRFVSQKAVADWLGIHQSTVNKAIKRGHTLKSLYKVVASK